tara:strand:+ start:134 stop:499 length:366 start_codon:yes stop_codon:yes gene_type:complete
MNKINFFLKEKENHTEPPTYEELVKEVDMIDIAKQNQCDTPDIIAQEINYSENYTKKALEKIADYYDIPKGKKKKEILIEEIVQFENNIENIELVFKRKKLWSYLNEIKSDKYLSKFLIFE